MPTSIQLKVKTSIDIEAVKNKRLLVKAWHSRHSGE